MTAGLTGFWMGLRPLQSSSPTAFGATPALAACAASVVAEVSPSVSVADEQHGQSGNPPGPSKSPHASLLSFDHHRSASLD
jgi:hypothetical protein